MSFSFFTHIRGYFDIITFYVRFGALFWCCYRAFILLSLCVFMIDSFFPSALFRMMGARWYALGYEIQLLLIMNCGSSRCQSTGFVQRIAAHSQPVSIFLAAAGIEDNAIVGTKRLE